MLPPLDSILTLLPPLALLAVAPTVANVSEAIELTFVRFGVVSLGLCF